MGQIDQFIQQIARAEARADQEVIALAALPADAPIPAPPKAVEDRRKFLAAQADTRAEGEQLFERVIAGNELQPANYLERGAMAARAICRVSMFDGAGVEQGFGSGFLISPGVLITNNHVLPEAGWAGRSIAEFDYALDTYGEPMPTALFSLDPDALFVTSVGLDFTVVAVKPVSRGGAVSLSSFGWLPFIAQVGKVLEGEWLTIIQHPGGGRKSVCVRENRFLKRDADVLWYSTDTLGGSSGSPVFNNDWQVVALHHSGVPERDAQGRILTVDGTPYNPNLHREDRIKWVANEGIRVSRIMETLRQVAADHPLLGALLAATSSPDIARIGARPWGLPPTITPAPQPAPQPALPPAPAPAVIEDTADFDAPLALSYADRPGHQPGWLGDSFRIALPTLSKAVKAQAARLLPAPAEIELRYMGYSAIQHAARRLPILSIANVDFAGRFAMKRPADKWRLDPRLAADQQLGEFYYAGNQFDRGHLTRREDMEYGATRLEALERAADTMHFTNCAPQHSRFNQAKATWQGLELHLLEDSILRNDFRAVIATGPVLAADDPAWDRFPAIRYPRKFWKVAAARTAEGKPFAVGFLLDQTEAIDRFGIEAEVPFTAFKTYQVSIREVERLTGLTFRATVGGRSRKLSSFDPLNRPAAPESLRAPLVGGESASTASAPEGYVPLWSPRAIIRPS